MPGTCKIHRPPTLHVLSLITTVCLLAGNFSCSKQSPNAPADAASTRSQDLVGKWRLVLADGKPPAELYIQSQEIEIAADGTWTSHIVVQPPQRAGNPDIFDGKGTWSLSDDMVAYHYTPAGLAVAGSGSDSGKSKVRLDSAKLVVNPDFFMQARKPGPDVAGEYERR